MIIKGDINKDGKIDIYDLILIQNLTLNGASATDYPAADVNNDNAINGVDILRAQKHINADEILTEVIYE